jgi:predicted RNase H-like HicB family nuclease
VTVARVHLDGGFDDEAYWASVKELPGCITQADSIPELRRNLVDAISLYLEPSGDPAPYLEDLDEAMTEMLSRGTTAEDL